MPIQLKGRFTIDKKYIGKDIFISFLEDEKVKIYKHDDAVNIIPDNVKIEDLNHSSKFEYIVCCSICVIRCLNL